MEGYQTLAGDQQPLLTGDEHLESHSTDAHRTFPFSRFVALARAAKGRLICLYEQLTCDEISGSFGDLGTFIPLFVGMSRNGSIHPRSAMICAGIANIVTGLLFDIPLPVQPMKAIAAAAIAVDDAGSQHLTQEQVFTAGILMGILLTIISVTNTIDLINRYIPTPVVSGLQMGVVCALRVSVRSRLDLPNSKMLFH
jgi:small basic protein